MEVVKGKLCIESERDVLEQEKSDLRDLKNEFAQQKEQNLLYWKR